MDKYTLLPIKEQNAADVLEVAKNVFGSGVSLLLPKKNMWGFYATDGTHIVGAVLLDKASETEGILSWIFVDKSARGHGLASKLIKLGFDTLDSKGLTKQFTLVRDDNTASWNMFYKAGYKILPLHKTVFGYSLKGILKRFNYMMLTGYSIWVKDDALKDQPTYPKYPIIRTLLTAIFIGAAIALFGLRSLDFLLISVATVFGITLLRITIAYPIARLYGPVRFMHAQGAFLLSFLLAVLTSAWWPTFGFFVPKEDVWHSRDFKKNEGIQAFVTWLSLNAVFIISSYAIPDIFSGGLNIILMIVLIYQMIPFMPFDAFDGAKVFRWHKLAYVIGLMISLVTIIVFI